MKTTNKSKSNVQGKPEGFHTVTPFVVVDGASDFIKFAENVLGAKQVYRMDHDDGRVWHATIQIGDSVLMVADTMDGMEAETHMLYLYVDDPDAFYKKAIDAKAKSVSEPKDEPYGDRASGVADKWGNKWWFAKKIADVSEEDIKSRSKEREKVREKEAAHA